MGLKLKTKAHMQQLIRTRVGPFNEEGIVSLLELKDAYELYKEGNEGELRKILRPTEKAIEHLPKIWISDQAVDPLSHGTNLAIPGIVRLESKIKEKDIVAVLTLKNELVGTGIAKESSENILKKEKGIAVDMEKVFMQTDVYPPYKKE